MVALVKLDLKTAFSQDCPHYAGHPGSRAFLSLTRFLAYSKKILHETIEIFVEHAPHVARS